MQTQLDCWMPGSENATRGDGLHAQETKIFAISHTSSRSRRTAFSRAKPALAGPRPRPSQQSQVWAGARPPRGVRSQAIRLRPARDGWQRGDADADPMPSPSNTLGDAESTM